MNLTLRTLVDGELLLLAVATHQHVAAIEPLTGKIAWRYPWKTEYDINAAGDLACFEVRSK